MDYSEIVDRLSPALRRTSRGLSRPGGGADPEDLFQEGLIWLWEGLRRGTLDRLSDAYILGGCRFHLMNRRRRESLRRRREVPLPAVGELPAPDTVETTDRKFLVAEMLSDGLSRAEKEVVRLRYEGNTVREVGARLGLSHVRVVQLQKSVRAKWGRRYRDAEGSRQ